MLKLFKKPVRNRIVSLPVLVLMPHSSCNCRCVMCDIWKANQNKQEISVEELEKHISAFRNLKVREVTLSGGEALLHSNLWRFCQLLRKNKIRITLLSTGLLLSRYAQEIVDNIDEVIVSLDGSRDVHNQIRNIPHAYEKMAEGIESIKAIRASFPIKGRCVIQKRNYLDFINIVRSAKSLTLDQISFLAADVTTDAFNRAGGWDDHRRSDVTLDANECQEFGNVLNNSFQVLSHEYRSKFIAESERKIMEIYRYYLAFVQQSGFPVRRCNAPWVSAVIEADGEVRPCFFHESYGNISQSGFVELINSEKAISFRKNLDVKKNPICEKCVCTLYR